jgi:S-adenosylmethionine synthetase
LTTTATRKRTTSTEKSPVRTDRYLFTSESVTEGHPDKIADQISDGVLDCALTEDPLSRVACETLVTTGLVVVAGEITTRAYIPVSEVARRTIKQIGYVDARMGFDYQTCGVLVSLDRQSPDIAQGVDREGAGDQGMMFGYATDETRELMPLPISLAHALTRQLATKRKDETLPWVRPDGKSQVTVEYDEGRPREIKGVVVSTQTAGEEEVSREEIEDGIQREVIQPVLPRELVDEKTLKIWINPTGRFVVGGPQGDAGLTGRKIIVDSYGGMGRHGGGAFSGKDPTKVDRSGAYAARWIAKHVVASQVARLCEVQIAYAIGVAEPVSIMVDTFGTGKKPDRAIAEAILQVWNLTPRAIIEALDLRRPIYQRTAAYGHFGREPENGSFTWERLDRLDDFKSALGA